MPQSKQKMRVYKNNWNPLTLLVGMWNGATSVENNLVALQSAEHTVIISYHIIDNSCCNYIPKHIAKRTESSYSNRNLYIKVCSNTIQNSQKVEAIQMSINRWMDKENAIYSHNGILFNHNSEVLIHVITWINLENIC